MKLQMKNPLAIALTTLMVIMMAAYSALPIYAMPIFGVAYGWEYISALAEAGKYFDVIPFLMPYFGGIAVTVCAFSNSRGLHLLSVSFSTLPAMFFGYFAYILSSALKSGMFSEVVTLSMAMHWSVWMNLALSLVAIIISVIMVKADNKKFKSGLIK